MRKLALLLLPALALTACGGPEVKSGTVINKTYTEESGYFDDECFAYSPQGACTMLMPVWEDVPASWTVTIQNCDLKQKPSDPCPTEDWDVSQSEFNQIQVGQQWNAQ